MIPLYLLFLQANPAELKSLENIAIIGIVLQISIALSILKVWVIQYNTIKEDFKSFNLPDWLRNFIGTVKILLSVGIIAGIWLNWLAIYVSIMIAALMIGAITAHYFAGHTFKKSFEAVLVLMLCLAVIYLNINYHYQAYILSSV